MRSRSTTTILCLLTVLLLPTLLGCAAGWQVTIIAPDGSEYVVDGKVLESLQDLADPDHGLSLERTLWLAGHKVIDKLLLTDSAGQVHTFDWPLVAEESWWAKGGQVIVGGEQYRVHRLEVKPSELALQMEASIQDIAATVSASLGMPAPDESMGRDLGAPPSEQVLLLFLDAFGYVRYQEALAAGLIPNLSALGQPLLGVTAFPPSTKVGSAALLTGAPPEVNGTADRSSRKTDLQTLFDVATANGLAVEAVEGESLAFNLRSAETQLSGDRDGDGHTDDNVLQNSLALLEQGMPNLLWVHFHGIDDAGHTYGPGAPEEEDRIRTVDEAVGQILEALPDGVTIIIFADHGMHQVQEEGRQGNHGHLIERDMLIPIFVTSKS